MVVQGYRSILGLGREAILTGDVWPSTTAVAATAFLPYVSGDIPDDITLVQRATRDGQGGTTRAERVTRPVTNSFIVPLTYELSPTLWTMLFGYEAKRVNSTLLPEDVELATAYKHLYELDEGLQATPWQAGDGWRAGDGLTCGTRKTRRFTLANWRGGSLVYEALSCMMTGFALNFEIDRLLSLQCSYVGHSTARSSTVNTSGGLQALPETMDYVHQDDITIRLGAYSTSTALDSGDNIQCDTFTINAVGSLRALPSRRTGERIEEPRTTSAHTVSGTFRFPRYIDGTQLDWMTAATPLMMTIDMQGSNITGTSTPWRYTWYFPYLYLEAIPIPITSAGILPATHRFIAIEPPGEPAGFPTHVKQGSVLLEHTNDVSAHPLT